MRYIEMLRAVGFGAAVACAAALSACSSVDGYGAEGGDHESVEGVATHGEALFYEKPGACANYEAEHIAHIGGSSTTGGWRLSGAGESISVDHAFSAGEHTFAVVAWGSKGSGSAQPQIRLSLNGYPVGDVTITNNSYTDGWREYLVHYDVATGSNKVIKVELLNPGEGRSVRFDGISVYCPAQGVICDDEPGCEHCYSVSSSAEECREEYSQPQGRLGCDQASDCSGSSICAFKGSFFDGFMVGCMERAICDENEASVPFVCRDICKTPDYPETPCPNGRVCADLDLNPEGYELELTGWKFCVSP